MQITGQGSGLESGKALAEPSTVLVKQLRNESERNTVKPQSCSKQKISELPILYNERKSWAEVLAAMKKTRSFSELEVVCTHLVLPPLPNGLKQKYDEEFDTIHLLTWDLLQAAKISFPSNHAPIEIIADGNCLPHTLSKLIFGAECHHIQVRVRLVRDGVLNREKYLSNANLTVGACTQIPTENLVQRYCLYSDCYETSRTLTQRTVGCIYDAEWFEYRKLGQYSGIFQLHAAANILQVKVQSYFPDRLINSVYVDMHRSIYPLGSSDQEDLETCHVVWTKSCSTVGRLQHFVPLMETQT